MREGSSVLGRENGSKDSALPTHFHFLDPAPLCFALADGSIYEPADLPGLELPRRTIPSGLDRALLNRPTRTFSIDRGPLKGQKKKRLALGVNGDPSPALFKALYGLERNAQELGHL